MANWQVVLVGDRKGPITVDDDRIAFLDLERQSGLGFEYAEHCPENHYARKNVGYLFAIAHGAELIAETDDDNLPLPGWGLNPDFSPANVRRAGGRRFFNAYRAFTDMHVWPRGFPLREILAAPATEAIEERGAAEVAVWQELADEDPDVDAIFRLTRGERISFRADERLVLEPGVYCPFNSQNTFWRRSAFAALFLPGRVSMRYCDILRGLVAQRLFWAHALRLGFGPATVRQMRNSHDLMRDFQEELPMYRDVEAVVDVLESVTLQGSMGEGLVACYSALADAGLAPADEITAARAWHADLRRLRIEP